MAVSAWAMVIWEWLPGAASWTSRVLMFQLCKLLGLGIEEELPLAPGLRVTIRISGQCCCCRQYQSGHHGASEHPRAKPLHP